jgi:hypothetical protein
LVSIFVTNFLFSPLLFKSLVFVFQFVLLTGIGKPPGQMDPKAFLLQKFNVTARQRVCSWFTVFFNGKCSWFTVECTFGSSSVTKVSKIFICSAFLLLLSCWTD